MFPVGLKNTDLAQCLGFGKNKSLRRRFGHGISLCGFLSPLYDVASRIKIVAWLRPVGSDWDAAADVSVKSINGFWAQLTVRLIFKGVTSLRIGFFKM